MLESYAQQGNGRTLGEICCSQRKPRNDFTIRRMVKLNVRVSSLKSLKHTRCEFVARQEPNQLVQLRFESLCLNVVRPVAKRIHFVGISLSRPALLPHLCRRDTYVYVGPFL